MKNAISGFKVLTEKALTNNLLEFEMDVPAEAEALNVYKKDDIDITIKMVSTSGKVITADAFYYEEYSFAESGEIEAKTEKKPVFRIRVTPSEEGKWEYTVSLKIKNENKSTLSGCLDIYKSEKESRLLSVEPKRRQVFATQSGNPVVMIGENLCYNQPMEQKNSFSKYVTYNMSRLAENGANHVRIFDMVNSGSYIREGVHKMSQSASAMWDRVFETADNLGMYITFVTADFSEITQGVFIGSPWHEANGGYISDAEDFFSDEKTKEAYKTYLRYVVSRWGYSDSLLTWELFNEMDRTDAMWKGRHDDIGVWLSEMADYLRDSDSNRHMLSNSVFFINLVATFYKPFDFAYYHQRNHASVSYLAEIQKNSYRAYNRPALNGDGGVAGATENLCGDSISPDLTIVHQGNWAGVMGGGAGTVLNSDWQKLFELSGEWIYKTVSKVAKQIPWCDLEMKMVTTETVKVSNNQISLLGYTGDGYAYLWIYDNHLLPIRPDETDFENEYLYLTLIDGIYTVEWMDTRTGEDIKKEEISVNGTVKLEMPAWSKDIALIVKLK